MQENISSSENQREYSVDELKEAVDSINKATENDPDRMVEPIELLKGFTIDELPKPQNIVDPNRTFEHIESLKGFTIDDLPKPPRDPVRAFEHIESLKGFTVDDLSKPSFLESRGPANLDPKSKPDFLKNHTKSSKISSINGQWVAPSVKAKMESKQPVKQKNIGTDINESR